MTTRGSGGAPSGEHGVAFGDATRFWIKLGFINFGGPTGQIAIMHEEIVERRRWVGEGRFLHALNFCMLLPGPEATQLAIYIGWLLHKVRGGVIAGVAFVVPSFVLLLGLSWVYAAHGTIGWIAGVFSGLAAAVIAIVAVAGIKIARRALSNPLMVIVAVLTFLAIFVFHLPFPLIIASAIVLGLLGDRIRPGWFEVGVERELEERAAIRDDAEAGEHTRPSTRRSITVLGLGLAVWLVPLLVIAGWRGAGDVLTEQAWFFSRASLITFGGAYAVLPYVNQAAVEGYGWLTPLQMIDGLALGETTPGPLIMVVAFVGFVAGWTRELFGPDALFAAGVAAATAATFFTFLPSFLFILVGGPLVEATHGEIRFTAPLTAITAAVVGVILDLALYFGQHVLWPRGLDESFEWPAAIAAVAAAAALIRFKIGVVTVILACAVAGMGWHMLLR